jgi:plastocyanin domain-containing protein
MKKQTKQNKELLLWAGIGGIALCVVVLLFFFNALDSSSSVKSQSVSTAVLDGDVQEVRIAVTPYGYEPSTLVVEENKPVRMIVDGTRMTGCTSTIMSQQLGFRKQLKSGENIIEFTAPKKGTYGFSCGMGMVRGTLNVIAAGEEPAAVQDSAQLAAPSGSCSMGGCGCGG